MKGKEIAKKGAFFLFFPITSIWVIGRGVVRNVIALGKVFVAAPKTIRASLKETRSNIKREQESPLEYDEVAKAWGIIDQASLINKRAEILFHFMMWLICCGLAVLVLLLGGKSFGSWFTFALLVMVGLAGVVNNLWRLEVLRKRHYTPFLSWIRGKHA